MQGVPGATEFIILKRTGQSHNIKKVMGIDVLCYNLEGVISSPHLNPSIHTNYTSYKIPITIVTDPVANHHARTPITNPRLF